MARHPEKSWCRTGNHFALTEGFRTIPGFDRRKMCDACYQKKMDEIIAKRNAECSNDAERKST